MKLISDNQSVFILLQIWFSTNGQSILRFTVILLERVESGQLSIKHMPTQAQLADILPKHSEGHGLRSFWSSLELKIPTLMLEGECCGTGSSIYGDSISRYRTDFHEIEQIGYGNFSRVFKVLKRIDGCMYAVQQNTKQLHNDTERMDALMEVQALAALGSHANIVGYYTSWFENDKLYIQMELCDRSMAINKDCVPKGGEILEALLQIATALDFMHSRGLAHMDVKPENIYVKNGIFKLGDFGCATMIDRSLCIDEGDARYMPPEMLNDKYEHLDKVDIFSLGATAFELVRELPLPTSGPLFCNLREGKIPLLPGCSMHLQNLIKVMMDPDPLRRPSAKQVMENAVFGQMKARKRIAGHC